VLWKLEHEHDRGQLQNARHGRAPRSPNERRAAPDARLDLRKPRASRAILAAGRSRPRHGHGVVDGTVQTESMRSALPKHVGTPGVVVLQVAPSAAALRWPRPGMDLAALANLGTRRSCVDRGLLRSGPLLPRLLGSMPWSGARGGHELRRSRRAPVAQRRRSARSSILRNYPRSTVGHDQCITRSTYSYAALAPSWRAKAYTEKGACPFAACVCARPSFR
jgi:hypothetical protein